MVKIWGHVTFADQQARAVAFKKKVIQQLEDAKETKHQEPEIIEPVKKMTMPLGVYYRGHFFSSEMTLAAIELQKKILFEKEDDEKWFTYRARIAAEIEKRDKLQALKDRITPHRYNWQAWGDEKTFRNRQKRYRRCG